MRAQAGAGQKHPRRDAIFYFSKNLVGLSILDGFGLFFGQKRIHNKASITFHKNLVVYTFSLVLLGLLIKTVYTTWFCKTWKNSQKIARVQVQIQCRILSPSWGSEGMLALFDCL